MSAGRSWVLVVVWLGAFVTGGWILQRGDETGVLAYERARVLDDIIANVSRYYVDSLDGANLYDLAIDGMLEALDDPYTGFLREDDLENLTISTRGNYGGIGIRVETSDGWITVVTPLAGTPAEEAGILTGDRIIAVDGESTEDWVADLSVSRLRGDPGTAVEITVARPGIPDPLVFELERAEIHVTSVRFADVIAPTIGYVLLETVSETSVSEVTEAVDRVREAGATRLIIDLRSNPGGLLTEGVGVTDLFLDRGQAVAVTRGRIPQSRRTYEASDPQRWPEMPVIVLVNEFSASAAEIIAGALQDHDRALVLGTPTFGKGLVQTVFPLNRIEALRLTTSRWFTPSGRSIHRDREADGTAIDSMSASADSVTFRTDAGRLLRGGGGIRPDVVVPPDTLSEGDQALLRALGGNLPVFREILASRALEWRNADSTANPRDAASPAALAQLYRILQERGISVPRSVWEGGLEFTADQFRALAVRYGASREEEMRLLTTEDPVVQAAVELLRDVPNQPALFDKAGNQP